jgi:hypothetical protein
VRLPIPPPPHGGYFFGPAGGCAGAAGVPGFGMSRGTVFVFPSSVESDTDGLPDGGSVVEPGNGACAGGADGCPDFAGADAGADGFALSSTVLEAPALRVARIDSVSDVIMNNTADSVVAFDNNVAEPRGPNAVCDPMPPKAPARSAALPLCNSTTMIRKTQTRT